MLPSTGNFKSNNCPFYDSGLCERPYCHFRHVKKDSQSNANDMNESGSFLQKIVSAVVKKVLEQTEAGPVSSTQVSVPDHVDDLIKKDNAMLTTTKATYNPTPISELNKINNTDAENNENPNEQRRKHIPVPYTPRKPASLLIKRPIETNGASKPFIYNPPPIKYTPGSTDKIENDQYTPSGAVQSKEKYLPGVEKQNQEYTPNENDQYSTKNKINYTPSEKCVTKNKILEYEPVNIAKKPETSSVTYHPTPRYLAPCFSSDEDEPNTKKIKLCNDLNGLDDLGPEFDILDQILDEEKREQETSKTKNDKLHKNKITKSSKDNKLASEDEKREKDAKEKNSRSNDKNKSEEKHKSKKEDRNGKDKYAEKRSTHKSSSKDKDKSSREKKDSHDNKKSSSKSSGNRSKESEHRTKSSESKSKSSECSNKRSDSSSKSSESQSKHSDNENSSPKKSKKHSSSKHKRSKSKERSNSDKKHRSSKDKEKHSKSKTEKKKNTESDDDGDDHNAVEDAMDEEDMATSDYDEEAIALECKKIFEEYVPTPKYVNPEETIRVEDSQEEYVPSKKRISRTTDINIRPTSQLTAKPDHKLNAAQAMAERLSKVREFHSSKLSALNSDNVKVDLPKNTLTSSSSGNSKIRIAHVPYASTLINAKKTIPSTQNTKINTLPSTSTTITQTNKKGAQRVAHIPNEKFIDRPGVLEPLASKIPANIRSTYLNMMIDECLKLYISATDAYARAQHEELTTSKKCSAVQIYKNSAVLTVSRLRKELLECNGVKKIGDDETSTTKTNITGSWSIENKNKKTFDNNKEYTGSKLYNNIKKWILTEEQLQENGYPRPHSNGEKGRAIIYGQNKKKPPQGYIRTCCRCKKDYTVDKKGFPAVKEECIYHPNNKYRVRGEARYQCCSQDSTSDGCCVAPNHVYEYVDFDNLKGYVKTLPPETVMDDYGVYSLDCEMCYTTHGLDLTRITVIDSACKVVYETLVKPLHPIIDYNTRFSGITEEQMIKVRTTLLDVQATLLVMFNSKTILVGHSLESDCKALKLIHDTVIDTSVLFPHKMGPPYKRALRNLSSEHLKKIIQNSVDGHDSAEDARVCMELIHFKLKEDLKTR